MKVLTIIGARPQFVKAATVSRAFMTRGICEVLVHTGQHFDRNMSDIFFEDMEIPKPDYFLNINSLSHGAMTGRMLEEIEKVIVKENPEWVLVYGDTNSTLAGALAAQKLGVKIAHIEAGLRSYNMNMPEETNRILTDRISDVLFCPTATAVRNLKREGYDNLPNQIAVSGDVMYDAALYYSKISKDKASVFHHLSLDEDYVLATIHRQENTDCIQNISNIISALNCINKSIQIVVPLHPRTKGIIEKNKLIPEFKLIDPVGYFDMVELIKNSKLIMTDSGGLQKEAFFFEKPCVTLREQTEWVELVENGYNMICGTNKEDICAAFETMCNAQLDFSDNLYGEGHAAELIVDEIINKQN